MKNKNILVIVIMTLLLTINSYAQITINDFKGITWKVKEFYLNQTRYQVAAIDSLRYHFNENGTVELHKLQHETKVILNYSFNPLDSVLTLNKNADKIALKIKYADRHNFIYLMSDKDESKGNVQISEFRMVPE